MEFGRLTGACKRGKRAQPGCHRVVSKYVILNIGLKNIRPDGSYRAMHFVEVIQTCRTVRPTESSIITCSGTPSSNQSANATKLLHHGSPNTGSLGM